MKRLFSILFLVGVLMNMGCQKELDEVDFIYVGDWGSKSFSITIWEDGDASWEKKNGILINSIDHGRVKIEDGKIKLRASAGLIYRKDFDIDTKPTVDTAGKIYMVLDGETFYRH